MDPTDLIWAVGGDNGNMRLNGIDQVRVEFGDEGVV